MGKQERAMRKTEAAVTAQDGTLGDKSTKILAVALIPDEGGFRVARMLLPLDTVEMLEPSLSEPEVLGVQMALAMKALDDHARGESDEMREAASCPRCNRNSLRPHPSKPVKLCANPECNARVDA